MAIPLPEQDTILMREHAFRESRNPELVSGMDSNMFHPIEKVGLGYFNYKHVNLDKINANTMLDEHETALHRVYSNLFVIAFVTTLLLGLYVCINKRFLNKILKQTKKYAHKYHKNKNKNKNNDDGDDDDDDDDDDYVMFKDGVPPLVSSTSSVTSAASFPNSPMGSFIALDSFPNDSSHQKYTV